MRYTLIILAFFAGFTKIAIGAEAYLFQPGDIVQISVWQDSKLDRQTVIGPDGAISMPLVGRVEAGGRTAVQIEKSIKTSLSTKFQGELDVTDSFLRKGNPEDEEKNIYVMGEVHRPGQFKIKTETTVLQALALGGGLSPFAEARRIQVHRKIDGRDAVFEFNYRKFERGREPTGNIVLREGDVVLVLERRTSD